MNPLTASGLSLQRCGLTLLQNVDITLAAGELHVLLGANGAGKSTLLKALSGEWPPTSGRICLAGQALEKMDVLEQARRRAVLPQHDALAFGFTVQQLISLGRHAALNQKPAHSGSVLAEVMAATDTTHLAHRRYPELSGGERRRAQLARVLAQVWDVPQAVLLLDEPTHSLDLAHQHRVLTLLRTLAEKGFAVLASLHEINLAATYAHRISLLQAPSIVASGTPGQVLNERSLQQLYGNDLHFSPVLQGSNTQWLSKQQPIG